MNSTPTGLAVQQGLGEELAAIKGKAAAAVISVGARGVAVRLIQLGGTLVLAHLLGPHQFGLLAFGLTVLSVAAFLTDVGLGASLVRAQADPEQSDLEALLGLQLAVAVAATAAAGAIGPMFGEAGVVTALMIASVGIVAVRTPAVIVLERRLEFRPLAIAETAETGVFFGLAVLLTYGGAGLWCLGAAAIVRSCVGTAMILMRRDVPHVLPRISPTRVRRLIRFGLQYQAAGMLILVRDQGLNIAVALIGGPTTLGLWTLASRVLQMPFLLFTTLWRVAFPTMARALRAGADASSILRKSTELIAFASAAIVIPLIALGPNAVGSLFGSEWTAAANAIPIAGVALILSGPVSVAASGFLYGSGDARAPLVALAAASATWYIVGLTLLPFLGVTAVGIGWGVASLVEACTFMYLLHRRGIAWLLPALAFPVSVGAAVALTGWVVARQFAPRLLGQVVVATVAEVVFVLIVVLARRRLLQDASSSIRISRKPSPPVAA